MSHWKVREYSAADVPELCALWLRNFDDTENFVQDFHRALPQIGSGVVAELEGKIIGAAYTLNGQELLCPGAESVRLGFLYGVSVDREYRRHGVGAELAHASCELSRAKGAETVAILPARPALYDWYGAVLGMKHTLFRSVYSVSAEAGEDCTVISASEYQKRREAMLDAVPHVFLSGPSMDFAKKLMADYDGELYAVCGGIAAAYMDSGLALIRELIVPDGSMLHRAAASVVHAMGAEEGKLFVPSQNGDRYILSDKALPSDCVWNMSFD